MHPCPGLQQNTVHPEKGNLAPFGVLFMRSQVYTGLPSQSTRVIHEHMVSCNLSCLLLSNMFASIVDVACSNIHALLIAGSVSHAFTHLVHSCASTVCLVTVCGYRINESN